jgi:hypothetical protein
MPTYSIQGPDGKTYSIDGPAGASREDVIQAIQNRLHPVAAAPEAPTSAMGQFAKTLGLQQAPVAAGVLGFEAAAAPFLETGLFAIIPGLVGAGVAGYSASKAQEKIIDALPKAAKALGIDKESMAKGREEHPWASTAAELAAQLETFTPSGKIAGLGIKGTAEEIAKQMWEARRHAFANAAIGAVADIGQQKIAGQDVDWKSVAESAGMAAILDNPTTYGKVLMGAGRRLVGAKAAEAGAEFAEQPERTPVPPAGEQITEQQRLPFGREQQEMDLGQPPPPAEEPPSIYQPANERQLPLDFAAIQQQGDLGLTMPRTGDTQGDLFATGEPIGPGGKLPEEPVVEPEIAKQGEQTQFNFPGTALSELSNRDKLLTAFQIAKVHTGPNLRKTAGMPHKDFIVEVNKLKNEGIIEFNKKTDTWEKVQPEAERPPAGPPVTEQMPLPLGEQQGLDFGTPPEEPQPPAPDVYQPNNPNQLPLDFAQIDKQPDLPLTMPPTGEEQGDLFATGEPIGPGGQLPPDIEPPLPTELIAPNKQIGFDFPGTPIEALNDRGKLLRAFSITDNYNLKSLKETSGLSNSRLQVEINKLKNEGAIRYNTKTKEWEWTNGRQQSDAGDVNRLSGEGVGVPPQSRTANRIRPTRTETGTVGGAGVGAGADIAGKEAVHYPLEEPAYKSETTETPLTEGEKLVPLTSKDTGHPYFEGEERPPVEPFTGPKMEVSEKPANTRYSNAVEAIKKGDLGKALYHLYIGAGGDVVGPHGEPSPLRSLAESLMNVVERKDDRSKIITSHQQRYEKEFSRKLTNYEKQNIEDLINNDYDLSKTDFTDVDGNLTAAGELAKEFKPEYDRLLNVAKTTRFDSATGRIQNIRPSQIKEGSFGDANVHVEGSRLDSEHKTVIDRLKSEGKLAEYNPRTNSFYFTKDGLNDRTILHEMTHAATVKVFKDYFVNPKLLTSRQRNAAEHIIKIYETTKNSLGAKHEDAYKNIYEFVSHAATDEALQKDLSNRKSPYLESGKVRPIMDKWTQFTRALAKLFKLDRASQIGARPPIRDQPISADENALLHFSQVLKDVLSVPRSGVDLDPLAAKNPSEAAERDLKQLGRENFDYAKPTKGWVNGALGTLSNLPSGLRRAYYGMNSLHQLHKLYGDKLPSIDLLDKVAHEEAAEKTSRKSILDDNIVKWYKTINDGISSKKITKDNLKAFNDIAVKSTVHQIELLDRPELTDAQGNVTQRGRTSEAGYLKTQFDSLPKELREVYKELRDSYEHQGDEFQKLYMQHLSDSTANKLRKKFEASRIRVYLPLFRHGDYWLTYQNKGNETVTSAYATKNDRDIAARLAEKDGGTKIEMYRRLENLRKNSQPPTGFLGDIINAIKKEGNFNDSKAIDSVLDSVYESYLNYLPSQSIRQQFNTREGRLGMENDVLQTYAHVASAMETNLNKIKYASRIEEAVQSLRAEATNRPTDEIADVITNIEKQVEFIRNPQLSGISMALGKFSYNWYLAGNASSAFINATHMPMVVYPLLGGKHGFPEASSALFKASAKFKIIDGTNPPKGYEKLFEEATRSGIINLHAGQELLEARKTSVQDYTGLSNKINNLLNWGFIRADRYCREVAMMAAHDLEYTKVMKDAKEKGMDISDEQARKIATENAINLVKDAYGSAIAGVGPRYMQQPLPRIMLTFKRFALNRLFIEAQLFKHAFADPTKDMLKEYEQHVKNNTMTPEDLNAFKDQIDKVKKDLPNIRAIARRQLLGIYAMAFMFSGVAGMPLVGGVKMLASLLMDDKDKPYDAEQEAQKAVGDLAWKGPLNHYLNIEISSRTGWNDMLMKDDSKRMTEIGPFLYFMERSMGPAYSAFQQGTQAYKFIQNGEYSKAAEAISPAYLRNGMKALRYASEGALNKDGEKIVDQIGGWNIAAQALGFQPADLSEARAQAGAMKQAETILMHRRTSLIDQIYAARMNGSDEETDKIMNSIERFNDANPEIAITGKVIANSIKLRIKKSQEEVDGVHLSHRLRRKLMDEYGAKEPT